MAGATPGLLRSVIGAVVTALAGALHGLYGNQAERAKQDVPYTATGVDLERWASTWSITRKQPTYATGTAPATGVSGVSIAAGTRLQSESNAVYVVDTTVETVAGSAQLSLTALVAGASGNQAAGATLRWVNAPSGLAAAVIVGAGGLGGGADLESDDGLRARMLQRIQAPGHGGSAEDYETWALSIASITRAWVFPLYSGLGSVRVYVANDAYVGATLASVADVAAVQSYVDSVKPVAVVRETSPGVFVNGFEAVAPVAVPVNYTMSITPSTDDHKAAVRTALTELYFRDAAPEAGVSLNKSLVAIGSAGIDDFEMTVPSASPVAGAGQILTLGDITWV